MTTPKDSETLRRLDAAHHLHPFSDNKALAESGVRMIVRGEGMPAGGWFADPAGNIISILQE